MFERKLGFCSEVQLLISQPEVFSTVFFPTKASSGDESFHSEEVNERHCGFVWD